MAGKERISLRTGCFCNPGDGEVAHEIKREEMAACFEESAALVTFEECYRIIQDATGKVPNTIRVSLGVASNFADIFQFVRFLTGFKDVGTEPRNGEPVPGTRSGGGQWKPQ
ncbi:MAG: hypothetical protein M1337_00525 [Actinobacteria bacterium]|nr:hypothetical protein [Actinomycetota bacterium]